MIDHLFYAIVVPLFLVIYLFVHVLFCLVFWVTVHVVLLRAYNFDSPSN